MTPPLFHYTCYHHHRFIGSLLQPAARLMDARTRKKLMEYPLAARMAAQVVWLTEMPAVVWLNRTALGLTTELAKCDRTQYRYRATGGYLVPWRAARLHWPESVVAELEKVPGSRPSTWWLSAAPVPVVFDPHVALEGDDHDIDRAG